MTPREAIDTRGEPGQRIVTPFPAIHYGERVLVTAVPKRTAVYEDHRPSQRHLDLHEKFEVGELAWTDCSHPNSVAASSARGRRASRLSHRGSTLLRSGG